MSTVKKYPYQPLPEHIPEYRKIKKIHYLGKTYISEEIINELEKYIIDREEHSWDDNGAYDDVLDKIKELKEKYNVI